MSLFWSLTTNQHKMLECTLAPYAEHIRFRTGATGAWGLGYYSVGEVLQRVEPKKQGEPLDVTEVMNGIRADLIMMHTRTATVGDVRRQNVHPFRFKEWLFAHNGTISGFEDFRDKLCDAMPPFIQRGIQGDTDSEHLFHLLLSFLYDAGLMGRPNLDTSSIRDALNRAVAMVDEFSLEVGKQPSPGSFVISDGYSLIVLSRGISVDYVLIEGIRDCSVCRPSIRPGQNETPRVDHKDLRAVLVRSGVDEGPPDAFQKLDDNSFLLVTKDHKIEFSPFG
ncbi:MAG: hypothetical protein GY854_29250 [Deltaproteobacteria bacterium]|nr:hypothetical protein [Deltaproteobacteria bacterium]